MKYALTATPSDARFAPILCRGPIEDAFELAHELDYHGVELHLRHADDVDVATIRTLQYRYHLTVPTLGTGMAAAEDGLTFSDPDKDVRRRAVERVQGHIRLAGNIDSAVTIGLIRGWLNTGQSRADAWSSMMECLDECVRYAQECDVMLLLEPVNRYETDDLNRLEEAAQVVQTINRTHLQILADTFHMNIEECQIADSLRRHAACIGYVHLVDSNRQVPGHGHLDMHGILGALVEIGYDGYLGIEALPLPEPRVAAADGIFTIRTILGNGVR